MIHLDYQACSLCQSCIAVCHTHCLSLAGDRVAINHRLCSTCGQCVAVCPPGAITWNGIVSREIDAGKLPGYENLLELLKARHTVRRFKNQPVERDKLEVICRTAKLAPTNAYDIELFVVTDPGIISQLNNIGLKFVRRINRWLYSNPLIFRTMMQLTRGAVNEIDREKVRHTLHRGSAFPNAPALVLTVADPLIAHADASCQYALYNMILIAQTMGLGSCLSGSGKMFMSASREARSLLGIPRQRKILGALFVGYTDVEFRRTVAGLQSRITWLEPAE